MRWLLNLLDRCYKNIYIVFIWLSLCMIFVMFVALSAQYIGDTLSQKIVDDRSIELTIALDADPGNMSDLDDFFRSFDRDYNLRRANIRVKKSYTSDDDVLNGKFYILISKDKDLMDKLATNNKLAVLDGSLFPESMRPFVKRSKYDEYAEIETVYRGISIYIAISDSVSNLEKVKIMKTIGILNDVVFRKKNIDLE